MPANTSKDIQACPKSLSLRQRTFSVENEKTGSDDIPALNEFWATRSVFASCGSLLTTGGRIKCGVALEEWQHSARTFSEDMEFLLRCKHHVFWSYMVYQQTVRVVIASFLQRAVPFYLYENFHTTANEIEELYESALCLVIRITFRLLTAEEGPDDWIENDHHIAIITKHNLLTVPMMIDLMVATGNTQINGEISLMERLLQKYLHLMGNNIKSDLEASLNFFKSAFRSIKTQVLNEGCEGAAGGQLLPDDKSASETQFDDVTLYTLDCVYTLHLLLKLWPNVKDWCNNFDFGHQIANFYNDTLTLLYRNLYQCNPKAASFKWLNTSRIQLLQCFHYIVTANWQKMALYNPKQCEASQIEQYLDKLYECSIFGEFINDYQSFYSLQDDYKLIETLPCFQEVSSKMNALMEKIAYKKSKLVATKSNDSTNISSVQHLNNGVNTDVNEGPKRDIELEITMVLDCLPQLETAFVRKLLARYDNSELAIAAYLENNLPPDLLENYEEDSVKTGELRPLSTCGKLYTDESKACIIKRGKGMPIGPQTALELLDDKSDLAAVRHRYQEYSYVSEDEDTNTDENDDLYGDEMDDSYEGLIDGNVPTQARHRNKFRSAMADNFVDESTESSDNDAEGCEENTTHANSSRPTNNLDFCEDPAVLRARREAFYRAKWSKRSGGTSAAGSVADVKGRPKGQGQDKEVLLNRQKKRINKSQSGNHNRKAGASFKRNRGMFS